LEFVPLFKNLAKMLVAGVITFAICFEISNIMNLLPLGKYVLESVKIIVVGLVCFSVYIVLNLLLKMEYAKDLYERIQGRFVK